MIILIVMAIIIGAVVSGLTGISFLFWLAGGFVFFCGLPFTAAASFIHGEVSYAQDCADYRQAMSEIAAEERADEHEFAEDERVNRIIRSARVQKTVYNDNRQVHIHAGSNKNDKELQ
jgi:1,4-dihydroxy-2-naphthoate octaprenyltransferase